MDVCVCCGAPVPEGRWICWQCEHCRNPRKIIKVRPADMQAEKKQKITDNLKRPGT